jgi:class 3 adenylate cyclase
LSFDYKHSKKYVINILTSKTLIEKRPIPKNDSEYTYGNGIKSWVAALFVDIVDSSTLFKHQKEEIIARLMRSFSSEIVEILKDSDKVRQIGLRGDSVYAIYSAEYKSDLVDIFRLAYKINTFLKMFNEILRNYNFPTITAGIGLGASEDLVIKAGKKMTDFNDLIFIGNAVVDASNLSSTANRQSIGSIAMNTTFYDNIIEDLKKENPKYLTWIQPKYSSSYYSYNQNGSIEYYHCNIIQKDFDTWIDDGMK